MKKITLKGETLVPMVLYIAISNTLCKLLDNAILASQITPLCTYDYQFGFKNGH